MRTFTPTTKRGVALAREVLDRIEVEEIERERSTEISHANQWRQATWSAIQGLDALPKGIEVELVPQKALASVGITSPMVALDAGLTCGTNMCFAGHASHALGDRLTYGVTPTVARTLREWAGGRFNLRRFARKLRERGDSRGNTVFGDYGRDTSFVWTTENRVEHISKRARRALQLTEDEAEFMFAGGNDIFRLRLGVQRMEEGKNARTGKKTREAQRRLEATGS
jgi:hypothetical protein